MQCNEDDARVKFYTCSCFCTDNIFLEEYKLHVRFISEQQFRTDYQAILATLGCSTDIHFKELLKKIETEVERRRQLGVNSFGRAVRIKEVYKPLHKEVYFLQESYLAPEFLQIVNYCRSDEASEEGLLGFLHPLAAKRVYRFPVFSKKFCKELIEELEHFEQSEAPKGRPNTMNNYGALLYPDCGGHYLDSHKAFVVKYAMNEDLDLSYHYDNAEVTLNVSLGKEFTEGNLYFGDMRQVPLSDTECVEVEHHVAEGLLHRGQHMHGALRISSGQRWNLIVWMRASCERNKLCPMCGRPPRLVEGEGFADGFTSDSQSSVSQNTSCVLN